MTKLLISVLYLIFFIDVDGYTCHNTTCIINCSSNTNNADTQQFCSKTTINASDSISLKLICDGDSVCNHLDIICPRNSNASDCLLSCNGNSSCNNINLYTSNSNSLIQCGNHPTINNKIKMPMCSNIIISSSPKFRSLSPQYNTNSQQITINCSAMIDQEPSASSLSPTCSNITIENIATTSSAVHTEYLRIICGSAYFISSASSNIPCYNFTIIHNELNISIYNYLGLKHLYIVDTTANALDINNYNEISNVYIASQAINAFNIYNNDTARMHHMSIYATVNTLINNGIMTNIHIHKFHNITIGSSAQLIDCNISSLNMNHTLNISGEIKYCTFSLNNTNSTLAVSGDAVFMNNTIHIHGRIHVIVDGIFAYNTIHLTKPIANHTDNRTKDIMNRMVMELNGSSSWINNTIIAYYTELLDIKTSSLFSGTIYTNDGCHNFSLQCTNEVDIVNTCTNLTLYTAPMYTNVHYTTYLNCVGYGCQYISIWSLNGLNDVYFSATECPCTVDCIDSCMGEWNIYCANNSDYDSIHNNFTMHSVFSDDICEPAQCCGTIINESEPYFVCSPNLYQNVVCKHSVGLDIALIVSLIMAGVIFLFFTFLGSRYVYRKFKNNELENELQKELQKKRQMEEDKKKESKKQNEKRIYKLQNAEQQESLLPDSQENKLFQY